MQIVRKVVAITLSGSLALSLYGCITEDKKSNDGINSEVPEVSDSVIVDAPKDFSFTGTDYEEIIDKEPVNVSEDEDLTSDSTMVKENGMPFNLTYIYKFNEENRPLYKAIDATFIQTYENDKNVLYDATGNKCLEGYDYLGHPFYWDLFIHAPYTDSNYNDLSGWIIPTFTEGTFSLYDLETFKPLLQDCTNTGGLHGKAESCFGGSNLCLASYADLIPYIPISYFYFPAYDWFNGGPGEGVLTIVEKDDVLYLVDSADFEVIYAEGFADVNAVLDGDRNMVEFIYPDGHKEIYPASLLTSYKSDVLVRKRK